ncbi:MAG: hypothetical protein IPI67_33250 [Myxococcales bacterium]|nr:hypothetical protein [Myxococcales bacterium]
MTDIEQLYEAIRQLTPTDRLRLVERVVHDVAEASAARCEPASIIGMMADEPGVMDEVARLVLAIRQNSRMRLADG